MRALLMVAGLSAAAAAGWTARAFLPAAAAPGATATCTGVGASEVRAIVASELARHPVREPEPQIQAAAPAAEAAAEVVAVDPVLRERAVAAIDAAMADGEWSDEDRMVLRSRLSELTPEEGEAMKSKIAVAVNEQRLRIVASGPPL